MSRQVLPRLTAMTQFTSGLQDTASTFWESPNGQKLVNLYEAAVYNEYADAEDWLYIIMAILCLLLFWRFCCVCRERCCGSRKKKPLTNDCSCATGVYTMSACALASSGGAAGAPLAG